jgi:hypothetical protein
VPIFFDKPITGVVAFSGNRRQRKTDSKNPDKVFLSIFYLVGEKGN